ncbi:DHA1 family chloramphenicol resistance protein-like MFS transporter [Nocardia transvalensis]|uniref:DHA1 family chloramphenicol resistance protein-like MFS transporter n=1 Tax=Nocardia transvalensis TaxID=37333 RepID=A0A7W9PDW5_9NOCA|nr:Cmx/CmrA family chloramphenicol efflux MFS transporter [Nocardia transvalensis]MBB5913844.1 DHA1 family chloramphenicol resistance protein-like MFS transporter [Nocardia transvalensis]
MPVAVYVLGLAIFAQGTSELMLSGLLTEISGSLGVSVPQAGWLISAFAIGMLVGAPILAVVTARWSRRTALLSFLAVFVGAHIVGALTSDYWVLLATRVLAAFVYAGFWAVASLTAVGLVRDTARGKAMSVVAGGFAVANIAGLPGGTFIGQHLGWRAAFWAVALLAALTMICVLAMIPNTRPVEVPRVRNELRALATRPVFLLYGTTILTTSAQMAVFAYLGVLVTEATGMADGWVPIVLLIYGLGAVVGIAVGGRTADAYPMRTLGVGVSALVLTLTLLALTLSHPVPTVVLAFLLGGFALGINPLLNSRVFALAPAAPTLGAAANTCAFNVGITVGPWVGGLAIGAGLDYPAVAWIGVGLAVTALGVVAWWNALSRSRSRNTIDRVDREPVSARV